MVTRVVFFVVVDAAIAEVYFFLLLLLSVLLLLLLLLLRRLKHVPRHSQKSLIKVGDSQRLIKNHTPLSQTLIIRVFFLNETLNYMSFLVLGDDSF